MKRTGLKRKTRLQRHAHLQKRNSGRTRKLYTKQFGDHAETVRALPCCACGIMGPSEPAHVRSRGAGGTAKDLVPLCWSHHRDQHDMGIETFAKIWDLDLSAIAAELWEERDDG